MVFFSILQETCIRMEEIRKLQNTNERAFPEYVALQDTGLFHLHKCVHIQGSQNYPELTLSKLPCGHSCMQDPTALYWFGHLCLLLCLHLICLSLGQVSFSLCFVFACLSIWPFCRCQVIQAPSAVMPLGTLVTPATCTRN